MVKTWIGTIAIVLTVSTGGADVGVSIGHPIALNCTNLVQVREHIPHDAIDAILAQGGRVAIEYRPTGLVAIDAQRWTLDEDDDRWGSVFSYDTICTDE